MPIRHAQPADLPVIVDIYNASIPGRMATADTAPVTVVEREGWFRRVRSRSGGRCGCTTTPGAIAGWLSLRSFYGRPAYHATVEVAVYVDPRRQRRGIARALLDHALAAAPGLGVADAARLRVRPQPPVAGAVRPGRLRRLGQAAARRRARRRRARPRAARARARRMTARGTGRPARRREADVPAIHALIRDAGRVRAAGAPVRATEARSPRGAVRRAAGGRSADRCLRRRSRRFRAVLPQLLDLRRPARAVARGPLRAAGATAAAAARRRCCAGWPGSPASGAAAGSSGPCSTGTPQAIRFYEALGGTVLPDWRIVRVTGPALAAMASGDAPPG